MTTDVFTFMFLRAPNSAEETKLYARYIKDDYLTLVRPNDQGGFTISRVERYIGWKNPLGHTDSYVGMGVFYQIYCNPANKLLGEGGINSTIVKAFIDELKMPPVDWATPNLASLHLYEDMCFQKDGNFYARPEMLLSSSKVYSWLLKAGGIIRSFLLQEPLNKTGLVRELEGLLGGKALIDFVFAGSPTGTYQNNDIGYSSTYFDLKSNVFEALYRCYIIRRAVSINLEKLIEGLRVLHLLEWLAVDAYLVNPVAVTDTGLKLILDAIVSDRQLKEPFIKTAADLKIYFEAMPVIHPVFARLAWYKKPFNEIRPIGIGDLKVVKQKLLGYVPGEISYIHNVMKGETYEKSHRRLDKKEDTVSFSSEQTTESEKEAQTTDKFEIKREAENVIQNDLQVNASTSLTYHNAAIVANISAGMSYQTSSEDSQKLSSNFAREVMKKAVSKVQNKASQSRTSTNSSEIEEINRHAIINTDPAATHQSGIYRWVDKKYESQVYNYGKRLMFEFIIPEPAAFYIQSRLQGYEMFDLEVPEKPKDFVPIPIEIKRGPGGAELTPWDIDRVKFIELQQTYDLSSFTYPNETKRVGFVDKSTGENIFTGKGGDDGTLFSKTYNCLLKSKGYKIENLEVVCKIDYQGKADNEGDKATDTNQQNTLEIVIDNNRYVNHQDNNFGLWVWNAGMQSFPVTNGLPFIDDETLLQISFWDMSTYELILFADLRISDDYLLDWRTRVYNKLKSIEAEKLKPVNDKAQARYDSRLSDYNNKLAALKAKTINDLIQGKSEAFNRDIILKELKKHCITLLMKEFDTYVLDDQLSVNNAFPASAVAVGVLYQKFVVDESTEPVTCGFTTKLNNVLWPAIEIEMAKWKGKYVQFLEQAFEWQQLAYIFYPYFWADRSNWTGLMNHLDETDKNMTDFLQAGSARVLLAVQPSYNHAVMHYLATRQPWEGGDVPVIGDALYLPLFEEIRKQQDDLEGAVPEGKPWEFTVPTSLVYLQDSASALPTFTTAP